MVKEILWQTVCKVQLQHETVEQENCGPVDALNSYYWRVAGNQYIDQLFVFLLDYIQVTYWYDYISEDNSCFVWLVFTSRTKQLL